MPVLISDGRCYRVPFRTFLKGNVCGKLLYRTSKSVSRPMVKDEQRDSTARMSSRATQDPGISTIPWTAEDDRLLRELKTAKVSWRKISMVIDDRPIRDLKRRWDCIRSGKPRYSQVYSFAEDADGFYSTIEQPYAWGTKYQGKERHVSFRTLPTDEADTDEEEEETQDEDEDEDEEEEENISQPPKIKRVYYIDDAFTLEDVLLLHKIASEWRKDRWTTISTRFNEMTGRHITPDEAKSVIDT